MDPGICFHSVYDSSHTQYACKINTRNCRTKNTATPECGELAQHKTNAEDIAIVHSRIFLCRRQGVIRTTVNTIEILAPLINDKVNDAGCASEGSYQTGT